MFCTNCGSKLKEDARFCTVCGKKVVTYVPPAASGLPTEPPKVEVEVPAVPQVVAEVIPAVPAAEPSPVVEEVVSVAEEATPVVEEAAPVAEEAEPVAEEAEPVAEEAAPVVEEAAPVAEEAEPVVEEAEPVVEEAAPVVEEAEPVAEEAEPVVEEAEPVAEEAEPVAEEAEPVVEEAEPVAEEAEPVVEEAEPVVEEAEPVAEEAEPVAEEAAPLFAAVPVTQQPQPAPAQPEPVPVQPQPVPVQPEPKPAPKQVKARKVRRKPHIVLRILLQLLSLIMCLVLVGCLTATVVLADLNHLRSAGGIKQLINAVLIPSSTSQSAKPHVGAATPGIPGNVDLSDLPVDLLTGGTAEENLEKLIDWAYEKMEESSKVPLTFTKEDVKDFVAESTVTEFVAEKLASYTEDFINGTHNTVITTEEIMDLIEENQELIEETFNMTLTPKIRDTIEKNVEKVVVEDDLNNTIRVQVFESVEQTIDESAKDLGMSWEEIQPMLQLLCADTTLYIAIGVCVLLLVLLCLLNYYNIPAGLTWFAVPSILLGTALTLPLVLLQTSPQLFAKFLPEAVVGVVAAFADVLIPIHGAVLVAGLAVLVVSIFWRVIRAVVRRKLSRAAVA